MPAPSLVGFAVEDDMHLPGSERIVVVRVDPADLLFQDLVTFLPARGWALFTGIVGTRSDLHAGITQRGTDRLDSEFVLMLVDELDDYFEGRSSSAAKKAEADFKIWLARRSSRFSFSRSLIRWASAVVAPGRSPVSTWSWLTQDRNVSGFTPSWSPIRRKIPRRAPGSAARASRTMRTALSRSSRGYFFWGMTGKSFPWLHCLHYPRGESHDPIWQAGRHACHDLPETSRPDGQTFLSPLDVRGPDDDPSRCAIEPATVDAVHCHPARGPLLDGGQRTPTPPLRYLCRLWARCRL